MATTEITDAKLEDAETERGGIAVSTTSSCPFCKLAVMLYILLSIVVKVLYDTTHNKTWRGGHVCVV